MEEKIIKHEDELIETKNHEELWVQKLKIHNVDIPDDTFEECRKFLFKTWYRYEDLVNILFSYKKYYYTYPTIYQMRLLLQIWVNLEVTFPVDIRAVNATIRKIYKSESKEFKKARTAFVKDELESNIMIQHDEKGKDYIIVYRGINHKSAPSDIAISWTYNLDRAKWFANRFACSHRDDRCCRVLQGKIYVKDILSVEHGREEDEIIAFPHKVFDISELEGFVANYDNNG